MFEPFPAPRRIARTMLLTSGGDSWRQAQSALGLVSLHCSKCKEKLWMWPHD